MSRWNHLSFLPSTLFITAALKMDDFSSSCKPIFQNLFSPAFFSFLWALVNFDVPSVCARTSHSAHTTYRTSVFIRAPPMARVIRRYSRLRYLLAHLFGPGSRLTSPSIFLLIPKRSSNLSTVPITTSAFLILGSIGSEVPCHPFPGSFSISFVDIGSRVWATSMAFASPCVHDNHSFKLPVSQRPLSEGLHPSLSSRAKDAFIVFVLHIYISLELALASYTNPYTRVSSDLDTHRGPIPRAMVMNHWFLRFSLGLYHIWIAGIFAVFKYTAKVLSSLHHRIWRVTIRES
uniref:Transmembrane protein n=1 Tax=Morchella brunnea TaxID=1174671 RepID=A0A8K1I7K9_9PEZI|nr:hypothetical protein LK370_mgp192 [Morchella brunnea]UBU98368.1 hypothetical protein [Morchella brunnea]